MAIHPPLTHWRLRTRAIEVPVYIKASGASETPIVTANAQNSICAVAGLMRLMPKLSTITNANGISATIRPMPLPARVCSNASLVETR